MELRTVEYAVVDDDHHVRDLLTDVLNAGSHRHVFPFENGAMAWGYLNLNDHADIIVSDVDMPGMDGFELLRKVKRKYPHKKCILMSGNAHHAERALALGADAFISKPFGLGEFSTLVNDIEN